MMIGVDIGGTKIEAVAIDADLRVHHRVRQPARIGPRGVTDGTLEAIEMVRAGLDVKIDSIGIGVPGAARRGVVHHARNLKIAAFDLEAAIADTVGVPVRVCNDVNAAAFGAWALQGRTSTSFAYLNLGTGLAAGLVMNGEVWEGATGLTGEIGYVSVDPNGPAHIDGLAGSLEGYASGSGVVAQWATPGSTARDVFDAAANGDERAIEIRDGVYFGAASAARLLALTFGTDSILLGGGLTSQGLGLLEGMAQHFSAWSATSPLLASLELAEIVEILPENLLAPAIGAALMGAAGG